MAETGLDVDKLLGSEADTSQRKVAQAKLVQADLERRFKDDLTWCHKEISHLRLELERSRRARADLEQELRELRETCSAAPTASSVDLPNAAPASSEVPEGPATGAPAQQPSSAPCPRPSLVATRADRFEVEGLKEQLAQAHAALQAAHAAHTATQQQLAQAQAQAASQAVRLTAAQAALPPLAAQVGALQAELERLARGARPTGSAALRMPHHAAMQARPPMAVTPNA